jgi:Tol biopolymer transport system component
MTRYKNQSLITKKFSHYNRSRRYNDFMRGAVFLLLLTSLLTSCSSTAAPPVRAAFYVFRFEPPALVELSADDKPMHEIPFSMPAGCGLEDLFPSPRGAYLAMELNCSFGQAVLWVNMDTGEVKQAFTKADSHFLAWTPDGGAVYLKVDSLGSPRILCLGVDGRQDFVPITELTYDLAPASDGRDFTFTFSRGMGFGSEMYFAQSDGRIVKQILADPGNYLSFARWSPDGKQIAFIKIPDSQTPFPMGELWLMNADGSSARKLADADAGHGFAPAWSPDGKQIAYVARENLSDPRVQQDSTVLVSNIYLVNVDSGKAMSLTKLKDARVETPVWSPDGNTLAFTVVLNDRMNVVRAEAASGETQPVLTESACCPAWIRK